MAKRYDRKKQNRANIIYTIIASILICSVFIGMVDYLYSKTQEIAYENLHVQTKQIKDDIILQLTSDRENLETMANFASKLYADGSSYNLLFDSFKPIGMIEDIGILNPDNTLTTKNGTTDLNGAISFEKEKKKGIYISGKTNDLTKSDYKLMRSAVPIVSNGETVGILYGAIKPEKLAARYQEKIDELDAQLFVYQQGTGDIIIDTVQNKYPNISYLKDRKYNKGYSFEEFISSEKGYTSFESAFRDENLHLHYSTIDEFGWMIAMGRYDSQVFAVTHALFKVFLMVFLMILGIIILYILIILANGNKLNSVVECASNVRKELLETMNGENNIKDALIEVCKFAKARSAIFFNTDGEFFHYISPQYEGVKLPEEARSHFKAELFHYASKQHERNGNAVNVLRVKTNRHLNKTNPKFYDFLKLHDIKEVSFSSTINKSNHITILAAINPKNGDKVRLLAEKVSACFSMALLSKNHLNKTQIAATTDSLTGALNRVAYKKDVAVFDEEKPTKFNCVYIDVNELHLCNNKYGHAAGDEMLVYIANTLKEVFCDCKIYRMGGDEFLVFCQNYEHEEIKKAVEVVFDQLKPRNYHIAVGLSYREQNFNTEDMVKEAEVRMYEAKAKYYQNKEIDIVNSASKKEYLQVQTGILEIDTMLSVLNEKYNGIYRVSLATDRARHILMPAYLKYDLNNERYSKVFSKYIEDSVEPDYHRAIMSFLNYDALKQQIMEGKVPKITYKKKGGELVSLSVYKLTESNDLVLDTLWVFAKE